MKLIDNFYVDDDSRVQLNKYKLVIRDYKSLKKDAYDEHTYYVNEDGYIEQTVNYIPKHQLVELVSEEELDTDTYSWMAGIELRTDNHWREIEEIAGYGSYEAYKASLSEATDEYLLDLDCRISMIELGVN